MVFTELCTLNEVNHRAADIYSRSSVEYRKSLLTTMMYKCMEYVSTTRPSKLPLWVVPQSVLTDCRFPKEDYFSEFPMLARDLISHALL